MNNGFGLRGVRRACLALWALASVASAQEETRSVERGRELVYRVFNLGHTSLRTRLGLGEVPGPDPFLPTGAPAGRPALEAGKLRPLFESVVILDVSPTFREAGIELPDRSAFMGDLGIPPLVHVRAAPGLMAEVEAVLGAASPDSGFENLWCRATIVVGQAGEKFAADDDPEKLSSRGRVLSDLAIFTCGRSTIHSGSLAEGAADEESWGSILQLDTNISEIAVSLRSPSGDGADPIRLDWNGEFELADIGKTRVVPVTFEGGAGALILRLESVPSFAWIESVEEMVARKEARWKTLGPTWTPTVVEPETGDDIDWAREYARTLFYENKTDTVYYETYVSPGFLNAAVGTGSLPAYWPVSSAGFRDVFGPGPLYDVTPILESYGLVFRPGDVAVYSEIKATLFARTEPVQIALLEAVVGTGYFYVEKMLRLRVATFEATAAEGTTLFSGRRLIADLKPVGIPESRSLLARSGQRARQVSGETFFLEFDPVLGPDDLTLNIHLTIKRQADYSLSLETDLRRGQAAVIPLGPPSTANGPRRYLAFRLDLMDPTGSLLEIESTDDLTRPEGFIKPATTAWEKRGSTFKPVPSGPPPRPRPRPASPPDPFAAP